MVLAVVLGTPFGIWLLDVLVESVAQPGERDIIVFRPPVAWYVAAGAAITALAAFTAAVPASQAARSDIVAVLSED
jgi:ABC-type antimicrobial peptide transport system permease subunit